MTIIVVFFLLIPHMNIIKIKRRGGVTCHPIQPPPPGSAPALIVATSLSITNSQRSNFVALLSKQMQLCQIWLMKHADTSRVNEGE